MSKRKINEKARCGILRKGNRIYITLEFHSEYEAMQMYDVWCKEEINFSFSGPKYLKEIDDEGEKK